MQALILAAGGGTRLRPLTNVVPKTLVEVNNTSFLANQLDALAKHEEIAEVIIVVGYKKEFVKHKIGKNYGRLKILYVENDLWSKTNNIYSLWLAENLIKSNFILMEGDVFFEPKLIDPLFANSGKSVVLLSKYKPFMSGTVVELDEDYTIIKRLTASSYQDKNFSFENKFKTINVCSFTRDVFSCFKPVLDMYVKINASSYWELVLGALIYLRVPNILPFVVPESLRWYEVDDKKDLEAANKLFSY